MDNILAYKGYHGIIKYSPEDEVFHGKIEVISDLVTFEAKTAKETRPAFARAVESYLEICEQIGKTPAKPELTQTPSPSRPCA